MTNSKNYIKLNTPQALLTFICLNLLAIAGNYFSAPFFFGVSFVFGSITVLIALQMFGTFWAVITAFNAALYPLISMGNPYLIIVFVCEALVVGLLSRKRNENIILLDGFYWILVGMPLIWFLHTFTSNMDQMIKLLIALKLGVNGLLNALIASFILTHLPLSRWIKCFRISKTEETISLRQMFFNLLMAFVLLPALFFTVTNNVRQQNEINNEIISNITSQSSQIISHLRLWQQQHLHAMMEIANLAGQLGLTPSQELQRSTDHMRVAFSDFAALYIGNEKGSSIAYSPSVNSKGESTLGVDFSDRDYYNEVRKAKHPVMSDVFIGRAAVPFPVITLNLPIIKDSKFIGYVTGGVDLSYINKLLTLYTNKGALRATIIDRQGKVVSSTRKDVSVMEAYNYDNGVLKRIKDDIYQWIPTNERFAHKATVLNKSYYVYKTPVGSEIPWSLIVEVPFAPYQDQLLKNNITALASTLILIIIAMVFATVVSRSLTRPISTLANLTYNLPDKLMDQQDIKWPSSTVSELDYLADNFKSMANILQKNFKELQVQFSFLQTLIDTIPSPIFYKDNNGIYTGCNIAFQEYLGLSNEEIIGKDVYDLSPKELADKYHEMDSLLLDEIGVQNYEASVRYADGSNRQVMFYKASFQDGEGNVGGLVGVILDITDLKKAEQLIWQEKERALVTLHSIGDAVITTDASGNIEYLNPVAENLTGWTNQEARGLPLLNAFNIINESTGEKVDSPIDKCLAEGRIVGLANHTALIHRDGHRFAIEDSAAPIKNWDGQIHGAVLVFHDVTDKRNMLKQLVHQAHHDPLTELPNRILFNDRLTLALANAQRNKEMLAVMFLDLDRFKLVNDTMGHAVGDQLLIEIAYRVTNALRETDTVSRLGGDEFTLLLPGLSHIEDAAKIAQKVLEALQQSWMINGHEFHITASIGIAIYPNDGSDAVSLLRHSDSAMYRAKEQGRNNYQLYTSEMNSQIMVLLTLENNLRHALSRDEFVVYYQPQLNTTTGQIIGMEALVRWQHPEEGLIAPGQFIPLAEETGLIIPMGEWVLRTACAQNKAWQDAGYSPIRVTVNLSTRQFLQQNLVEMIAGVLTDTGLEPRWLELEITESVAIQDIDFTIKMLNELKNMGIHIAIDDFGTGYSSLNYLKRFPIHTLKIDRSFVQDITTNPEDAAIVTTIIVLGKNLNLNVIAEGVETKAQLEFLQKHNCNDMQGYFFSKPIGPEDFERLLKENQ